ncbi:hypothetical protein ARMGADRAFT_1048415 [Armillaria gallica]|uniref:Uncharacterized protein n=1 Tax=Armillaria gallica TaxID=47427 RepID=A0A2H3D3J5_ARMGA|nr:hypothetical protein ARMGADRAFT_1048415 [Armillaria gallica]
MFLAGIIPGPKEPNYKTIPNFVAPIMDACVIGWERGYHISRTASQPKTGHHVDLAVILSVNDLPAACKMSGAAGHGSPHCSVCNASSHGLDTCFHQWTSRDIGEMHQYAYAWRDAHTAAERVEIFKKHGIRWSELWRLSYWDPTQMLIIDSMHCILEGLVHYHC